MDWGIVINLLSIFAVAAGGLALRQVTAAKYEADKVRDALSAFQVEAAKNFVTVSAMEKVENRIIGELQKIDSKLDRIAKGRN